MSLRFQCSSCQAVRAVNARLLGRQIKCPECGQPVQLPTQQQIDQSRREREKSVQEQARKAQLVSSAVVATPSKPKESRAERIAAEERALAAASTNFSRPKKPSGEDMDMTPMVDVTFLLLIFFMVTASFSVQKSVQRPPPREEDPSVNAIPLDPDENPDVVTVQVDEFNAFNVLSMSGDRQVGSKQDLIVALTDAHSGGGSGESPTKLVITAHEDCIHAAVIAALDAGREAKFESFEVSTVEQFD